MPRKLGSPPPVLVGRRRRFAFWVERLMLRGLRYRFGAVAAVTLLIALAGGALAYILPTPAFDRLRDAIWWAFLHLSDTGHLADDHVPELRPLAIVLTVLGLVVVMGALIAILTQGLTQAFARLDLGLTRIGWRGHVVVLGWSSRTPDLVADLLAYDQTCVAILCSGVTPELRQSLVEGLGERYDDRRLLLRSGDPKRVEHLARANCAEARAIVLPGTDFAPGGASSRDPATLKILASLDQHVTSAGPRPPRLAAEIFDPALVPVARRAYRAGTLVVPSDIMVARTLAMGLLAPGIATILPDLLNARAGHRILVRHHPELAGETVRGAASRFADGILIAVLRRPPGGAVSLVREPDARLEAEDRLALIGPVGVIPEPRSALPSLPAPGTEEGALTPVGSPRRVLVAGWSGKVPDLLAELGRIARQPLSVDVLATTTLGARRDEGGLAAPPADRVAVTHHVGNPASPRDLGRLPLGDYDRIVVLADGTAPDVEAADAATVAACLVLDDRLRGAERRPAVLVELLDPANAPLLEQRSLEVVVSPRILADALAGLVSNPDLDDVLPAILARGLGGGRLYHAGTLAGPDGRLDLRAAEDRLRGTGVLLLGVLRAGAPPRPELALSKAEPVVLGPGDLLMGLGQEAG